ncbi:hypothetical protein JKP88DRAFT_285522 [Tribonema minus]|uniref:Transmembrane protein n=1 Tax=Tribonema minus TaxID=303371 RepID=A0A835ZD65_9STRA|nr:hypothetical protein JKP88DRAFT_285522 [Tribonema minus]
MTGYPLGSAADLLFAARFQKPDDPGLLGSWPTTDRNVRAFMADYTLTLTQEQSRLDAYKQIKGTADLDIFLCSDLECTVVADLIYLAHGPRYATVTPAMGYVRFDTTVIGLPMQFIQDSSTMNPVIVPIAESDASATPSMAQVAWTFDDPQWVEADPILVSFGAMVRMIALSGNSTEATIVHMVDTLSRNRMVDLFNSLRIGNYMTSDRECVSIITFKHDWMDQQGWDTSHNCISESLFIFDSYFTQANLHWPPALELNDSTKPAEKLSVFTPLGAGAGNWDNAAVSVASYGRTLFCDAAMFRNVQTVAAGSSSCSIADGAYAAAQPESSEYAKAQRKGDHDAQQLGGPPRPSPPVALIIGNAAISAWNVTEDRLLQPESVKVDGGLRMEPYDYMTTDGGHNPMRGSAVEGSSVANVGPAEALLRLALGWGPVGAGPLPAVSGAELLSRMRVSWVDMTYGRPFGSSILSGINTTRASAQTVLSDVVAAELATTDTSYTRAGAFLLLSQTLVALLATYLGRHELVFFFRRARLPVCAAQLLTVVVFAFTIITPPALVLVAEGSARATGADGSSSTVRWVEGQAYGSGEYRVVGAVSVTLNAQHSQVANGLIWLNFNKFMDIVFGSNQAQGGARDVQRVLESASQEKIDTYVVSGALDPTTHTLFSAAFDHFGAMSRDTQALLHALAEQSSQGSYNLAQRVAFWRRRTSLALQRALTRVVIDNWNAVIAPDGDDIIYNFIIALVGWLWCSVAVFARRNNAKPEELEEPVKRSRDDAEEMRSSQTVHQKQRSRRLIHMGDAETRDTDTVWLH